MCYDFLILPQSPTEAVCSDLTVNQGDPNYDDSCGYKKRVFWYFSDCFVLSLSISSGFESSQSIWFSHVFLWFLRTAFSITFRQTWNQTLCAPTYRLCLWQSICFTISIIWLTFTLLCLNTQGRLNVPVQIQDSATWLLLPTLHKPVAVSLHLGSEQITSPSSDLLHSQASPNNLFEIIIRLNIVWRCSPHLPGKTCGCQTLKRI